MTFERGDPVRIEMEKWGSGPHWHIPCRWLGRDDHGDWVGIPAGTRMSRPGLTVSAPVAQVGLVPTPGLDDVERAFLATFHAPGGTVAVYVDMATPPRWEGPVLRSVDLDLDVLVTNDGRVVVDDEDEFAEHRVTLGYPPEVVALAEASRDRVRGLAASRAAPYDGTHRGWHEVLAEVERLTART